MRQLFDSHNNMLIYMNTGEYKKGRIMRPFLMLIFCKTNE